jgi:mannose-1-phosphate guanylyltransferase
MSTSCTRVAVIMAGGAGERFWPLSRRNFPKQLLCLTDPSRSMLEEAVARVAPLIPPEHIFVQTTPHLLPVIREKIHGVPASHVLAEPCKRNTAGAIAFAAAYLCAHFDAKPQDLSMAVLTADHRIGDAARFRSTIARALDIAEREEALVVLGVPPTYPATGYGYIQVEDAAREPMRVLRFHEKPTLPRAAEYVQSGTFFWNSGMFFWRLDVMLKEMARACPEFAEAVPALAAALARGDEARATEIFSALPDISIDYALMEKAEHVLALKTDFPWADVGSWLTLGLTHPRDAHGNVSLGNPVLIDAQNCIVYNAAGDSMAVGVLGVNDVIVVVTEDAVAVVGREHAERIREIVKELAQRNAPQI